ncbi:hypothetical protein OCGS_0049 [Oceaniovalibus guishaninsula JLT2003]|uniref:Aspartyl protease-like protein n=1 Tax=Oceaniovalibus guishaninsula JLT2003 TaxID=1231392 RepID=K2HED2_9RHOB|nr:TIGR02281 family clan AA aspartic protease [Oceaniovalibus guishaninsula]EKE45823.1 hypothetical protein OCGS_0049 [Oceaniovalibus guishaninsula JLT2003]
MAADSIASIIYLVLLGSVIGGYFFVSARADLGRVAQQAAIWGLIFVGAVAVAGLWTDIRDDVLPRQSVAVDGSISVPRGYDGHYRMTLDVDGVAVPFIVDTGASDLVLSQRDARRVGIDTGELAWIGRAQTANGTVPMARVFLDSVSLGPLTDRSVPASVNGGEMDTSLLGMSYLQHFGRIEIADDRLILTR